MIKKMGSTYWNFETTGMDNIPYKPLDEFLAEFFNGLLNNELISPEESFE